jgi:ATP-binding protein involved in chromosome partitioning
MDPEGDIAMAYRKIARRVGAHLATQGKDYSSAFPNIVIKND